MSSRSTGMAGFLLGAAGMFAVTYSTQAILPELGRAFRVSPSEAGLTISVVVLALAVGAWIWGPFSDRYGRKRSIVLSSMLLVAPTVGAALAPTFAVLLVFRALQGLCIPGLLTAGVPYITEVFTPRIGGRAMGYYVTALVAGGLIGRVGVALITAAVGWRWGIGLLAILPLAAALVMRRSLVDLRLPPAGDGRHAVRRQLRNRTLLQATAAGSAFFFIFVGTFSYVDLPARTAAVRLRARGGKPRLPALVPRGARPVVRPARRSDRLAPSGPRCARAGRRRAGLTLPARLPTLIVGLAFITLANFGGVTAAQLGVGAATDVDRGAASAVYFSIYYLVGAVGGYLPGLAWEQYRWDGVAITGFAMLALAGAVLALGANR